MSMSFEMCSIYAVLFLIFANLSPTVYGLRDCGPIVAALRAETWSDEEVACRSATLAMLEGVRNNTLWATWIWDSMQPPVGALSGARFHLGSFDQCLDSPWVQPWTPQYCLVQFHLTKGSRPFDGENRDPYGNVEEFVGMETKYARQLHTYSLGVCLPSVCSPSSVAKISRHLHQLTHLPLAGVTVDPSYCQVKEERPYGVGFYVFWLIIFTSASLVTLAYFMEDHISHPKLAEAVGWFSPSKNYNALTRTSTGELASLNGIRCMCAGIAVVMHYFYYVAAPSANNPGDIEKDIESTLGKFLMQLALVIDTFFVMSGLLHMKGLMTSSDSPVKLLWKRYLRILAPFGMSLLCITAVLQHTISGPFHPQMMKEQAETCEKNWWLSLFMLNNYVRNEAICHTVTWYLSCDYQLTIFGTILFCICKRLNRSGVLKVFGATFIISVLIPGALTYWYRLPAGYLYNVEDAGDVKINVVFLTTYMQSHSRASAYMIGLALGYLMHTYKPKDYRNCLYKELSTFIGSLGLMILVVGASAGGWLICSTPYNALLTTVYSMVDRSIWAVGICCLVLASEYGTFPIIGGFLKSTVFTPLSRLSFLIYLFHPTLLYHVLYSRRVAVSYSFFHHLLDSLGYVVLANLFAYCLWFTVEAPASNITSSFFKNRNNKTTKVNAQSQDISKNGTAKIANGTNGTIIKQNGYQNGTIALGNGTEVKGNGHLKVKENGHSNGHGQNGHTQNGHSNGLKFQPNGFNKKKE